MHDEILNFWFVETSPRMWWKADSAFNAAIARRFGAVHSAAALGELFEWRASPRGRLAEVIVLDQFSRNLFRKTAKAFASDPMALVLAQEAVAGSHDQGLPGQQRAFLYMPFMHSDSRVIHAHAAQPFASLGLDDSYKFELRHKAIIDRFGGYPHRNMVLGRESTPEELEFLQQPGSRF